MARLNKYGMSRKSTREHVRILQDETDRLNEIILHLEVEKKELLELNEKYIAMIKNLRESRQHPPKEK